MVIAHSCRVLGAVLAVLSLAGCRDGDLADLLDEDSKRRLDAAPQEASLVLSVRAATDPEFDEGIRLVERSGGTLLVEVTRESLAGFAGLPDLTHVAVWGSGDVLNKLDPALRGELLGAFDIAAKDAPPLAIIATFAPGAADVAAAVAERGAALRSYNNGVATLDATPDAALRLLELPDLIELELPTTLRPLEGR